MLYKKTHTRSFQRRDIKCPKLFKDTVILLYLNF